jgi:beta-fructofuranosidase
MQQIMRSLISSLVILFLVGCQHELSFTEGSSGETTLTAGTVISAASLVCTQQAEQTDYNIFKMTGDGFRIGDVMPVFDPASNSFFIYYLKDIWNDATHKRHPWYGFKTNNFYSYSHLSTGEILSCSSAGCDQDYALGTGSFIKNGSTYYAFYTGHNPNYPSACVSRKEGIMRATASGLNKKFTKSASFTTIYAPQGQGFDENDNFRDPYVFYNDIDGNYSMIVSARKNVNGTWRGVIAKYTSSNLLNWTYSGILYDGDTDNFFMMETPEVFRMGNVYYLLFSDIDTKHVYYRKSGSPNGPWSKPTESNRFEGNGIYAAKTAADNYDRYIFGWTNILQNHNDAGAWQWGGNLVVHKLYQLPNGDLAVTIPHTLKSNLESVNHPIVKNSQWGNVTNTIPGTESYNLVSNADFDLANVIYEPITLNRFKISATVSYSSSNKDFGFMIGACDGYEDFFSLRFVPSQNRVSLDKVKRSLITSATFHTDAPLTLSPNRNYQVQIVIENSMLVLYVDNMIALSARVYRATGTNWGIFVDNSHATFNNIVVQRP